MAKATVQPPKPKVGYSAKAKSDRAEIYRYTLNKWGFSQAKAYRQFLKDFIDELANYPQQAPLIEGLDGVRSTIARWPGSRDAHRVFFEETTEGILVLQILHTAMDWQGRLN